MPPVRRACLCVTATLVASLGPVLSAGADSDQDLKRLRTEAVAAWAAGLKHAETLQGVVVQRDSYRVNGVEKVVTNTRRVRRGPSGCWIEMDPFPVNAKSPTVTLWATNSRYTFRLKRHEGSRDWALTTLAAQPEILIDKWMDDTDGTNPPPLTAVASKFFAILYEVDGFTLAEFVTAPGRRITWPKNDDPSTVLVRFEALGADPPGRKNLIRDVTVRLAPAENWRVVTADGVRELKDAKVKFSLKFEARIGGNGLPVPTVKQSVYTVQEPGRSDSKNQTTESYDLTEDARVAESEFLLPAFGIPEPSDAPPPRRRYLWLLAGAAGFAAVAVFAGWVRRRRTA